MIVSKEARAMFSKCCVVFVNCITALANDNAMAQNRKSINSTDILHALKLMDLDQALFPKLEPAIKGCRL
jgi:histone H3/H4